MMELSQIRQFEAAGFRAWPAAHVHYDGSWAVRTTPNHPAKRLNSINPLDPSDIGNMESRIAADVERMRQQGVKPMFRLSPLAPPQLAAHLAASGWERFDDSLVMAFDLADTLPAGSGVGVTSNDVDGFVDAYLVLQPGNDGLRRGLTGTIDAIQPEKALLTIVDDGRVVAAGICVRDGALAGLFNIISAPDVRRRGVGTRLVRAALDWAAQRGARKAWLQVELSNGAAIALYHRFGFQDIYRYHYMRMAGR
ncbi:GNAT family N-acetyltransferase [Phyllobacterium sp. 0TCS1.6C]|uniref:GNAT family N-acetyltransferase n=2 Tax=unclassified Phyllobacterium TaxID=2638441 RepID=UPI002263C364|nr:GNAT family N-acetyltransferase [Phyllobacterium sp. 0TCS1.6C]